MEQTTDTPSLDVQQQPTSAPADMDSPAEVGAESDSAIRLSWPHLYLGALGFAISLYTVRLHNIAAHGGETGCGLTETISCDRVLTSPYATPLGIPLGAFGMAFFIVVIMTGITTNPKTTELQAALWRLLVLGAGACGSSTMLYISFALIKAACPYCMATHAVVFTLFVISLFQFLKARRLQAANPLTPPDPAR
jgi:uncharacterized membrane protein